MALSTIAYRTITANVTTEPTVLFQADIAYTSTLNFGKITNLTDVPVPVTFIYSKYDIATATYTDFEIYKNFMIPANDTLTLVNGDRLSFEHNDRLKVYSTENNALNIILSIQATFNV